MREEIRAFILERFLPGEDPRNLTDDTPLMTSGILDSLATMMLVEYVEERFGVTMAAHEASAGYLNTVREIAELVQKKML